MRGWMKHIDFTLFDLVCLEAAFFLSYSYRNGFPKNGLSHQYENMVWAIIFVGLLAVFFLNTYTDIVKRGYIMEIKSTLLYCGFVSAGLIIWMFIFKESSSFSRMVVLSMYPVSVGFVTIERLAWKRVLRTLLREKEVLRKVIIISTEKRISDTIEGLLQPYRSYQVSGCVIWDNAEKVGQLIKQIPVVATKDNITHYIHDNIVDEMFIDLPGREEEAEQIMALFVNVGLVTHLNLARFTSKVENKQIQKFADCMVLSSCIKFATPRQLFFKRTMDIAGALVGLAITGIAFLVYAPIIKKQSPGPVLFSQKRVGRNGRKFKIYKFRTMFPDAEDRKKDLMKQNKMSGHMFKMDNDPRIIPIGHFLRKTSIDELPQFLNVLRGDMSLVGTRPPTVDEYEKYEAPHRKRLAMRPGLTGLWQVSGRSDIVDFEEVVALDAKYITEWTLGLDIKIIWKTVGSVIGQKGAT